MSKQPDAWAPTQDGRLVCALFGGTPGAQHHAPPRLRAQARRRSTCGTTADLPVHGVSVVALADLADRAMRARLDGLLELRADGTTWIEWLRTPAGETSRIEIRRQLEKFRYLEELGAGAIDLSDTVTWEGADARRRRPPAPAWELARLAASVRLAVLLAFYAHASSSAATS